MFTPISEKEAQQRLTKRMFLMLPAGYQWHSMVGTPEEIDAGVKMFGEHDACFSFFDAEDEPLFALLGVADAIPVQMSLFGSNEGV